MPICNKLKKKTTKIGVDVEGKTNLDIAKREEDRQHQSVTTHIIYNPYVIMYTRMKKQQKIVLKCLSWVIVAVL